MRSFADKRSLVVGELSGRKQSFDVQAFAAIYGGVTRLRIPAGATIYAGGEPPDCLFYIETGQALLKVVSPQGKEAIIAVLDAGEFCGDGCVAGHPLPMSTAKCITDSIIIRLEKTNMIRALRQDRAFAEFYLAYVLNRVGRLRDSLISQLTDTSERRLARILLQLSNYGQAGRNGTIIRNVDQEALAQMVGTTRSRINQFMNKFRRLGYINYNGEIVVQGSLWDAVLNEDSLGVA